jgi:hypothetical protein
MHRERRVGGFAARARVVDGFADIARHLHVLARMYDRRGERIPVGDARGDAEPGNYVRSRGVPEHNPGMEHFDPMAVFWGNDLRCRRRMERSAEHERLSDGNADDDRDTILFTNVLGQRNQHLAEPGRHRESGSNPIRLTNQRRHRQQCRAYMELKRRHELHCE